VLPITFLRKFSDQKIVGVSIADHASINSLGTPIDENWNGFVDFVFTTNDTLLKIYSRFLGECTPVFLLQDLPNMDLIRNVPLIKFEDRRTDVIWIGNSEWGVRQGYKDHKGLNSVFFPAVEIVKATFPNLRVQVIDSATKRISHSRVIQELADAKILVQTSLHEGTGLPVLEALMLGCRVVSTPVGAAQSIGDIDQLILSDFLPEDVAQKILLSLNAPGDQFRLENYLQPPPSDSDLLKVVTLGTMAFKPIGLWPTLAIRFKWRLR
jgi:hypothetical protein